MKFKEAEKALRDLIRKRSKEHLRIIAVDVDGTLARFDYWRGYTHVGKPIKKVVNQIRREHAAGSRIIIHTCRVTNVKGNGTIPEAMMALQKWLKKHDIPYHTIWTGIGKPYASEYWDDKSVRKP